MHKYALWVSRRHPPTRLSPKMGTESDFESILNDFRSPPETPLGFCGDQFSASTRPVGAKETKKGTQSSDCAEDRVSDGLPEGIAVTPGLHFILKML